MGARLGGGATVGRGSEASALRAEVKERGLLTEVQGSRTSCGVCCTRCGGRRGWRRLLEDGLGPPPSPLPLFPGI